MAQCPGWHGLKSFQTSHRGFTCDGPCGKRQSIYSQMWGCRICDFDLCSKCYAAKGNMKKGSESKIKALFLKHYADPNDTDIMSEKGMIKFFKDCGVDPASYETLMIAYHLKAEEMGIYDQTEFIDGFAKSGCSTKKEIKSVIRNRLNAVKGNEAEYKKFYKWLFHHVKEEEKKKTIPTELALQLWTLVLRPKQHHMKLLEQWLAFCAAQKEKELKVVSRDVWEQIYEFLWETQSVDDYVDDGSSCWPVAVDEFVEWIKESQ